MRRSHPPTLLRISERTIAEEGLFARGDLVLIAVSGGPDSMALVHVLAKLAPRLGIELTAHGVDHGLREAAAEELALAARFCAGLGVPFSSTRVQVRSGANLMARARAARYEALESALRGWPAGQREKPPNRHLATAHHADDRAETVLIRLLRGAGPAGLAVLPPRAGHLVRPFIRASRADIVAHIERHTIPHALDPTNRDPRFLRTRVRSDLLPLLQELSPRIVEHLCDVADGLQESLSGRVPPVPASIEGERLGRAQRTELARALRNRNRQARVPLAGGKIATVDLSSRTIVLMKAR